ALGVSVVVTAACLAFAVGRGLGTWRVSRRSQASLTAGLEAMNRRVEAMEERLAAVDKRTARLERAQAELQMSIAAARALADAVDEVRRTVRRVLWLLPTG